MMGKLELLLDKFKDKNQYFMEGDSMEEITWVAQYHAKDDTDGNLIKLGIREEGNLTWVYFDFDTTTPDLCAKTKEKTIEIIEEAWGWMDTFSWIK
jgi:hypothetical protein